MRNYMSPNIEIAGHRDAETGELDLVVYVDGEQYCDVLWHVFDAPTWREDERDSEGRIPRSLWRAAAQKVASEGTDAFASMITAFASIDDKDTVDDLYPATNAQPDVTTTLKLDPAAWYREASSAQTVTAMSAAHGVAALLAFHTSDTETIAGKTSDMVSAYRAVAGLAEKKLTEALTCLLESLRQFADAREIQIEARPHYTEEIACDLADALEALRVCATTAWARQLQREALDSGTPGDAEDVFARIKATAYQRYFERITRKP